MAKKRSKESYHGNTEEMIRRQRSGLIPGGDIYQKREISEARYNCYWGYIDLKYKQFIYESWLNFDNLKDFKAIHKKELESEEYLDNWWVKLELEQKKNIYKAIMGPLTPEEKTPILEHIQKMLKEEISSIRKRLKGV
ncbi:hypothetical protein ES705_45519 [subsurface metagenome]